MWMFEMGVGLLSQWLHTEPVLLCKLFFSMLAPALDSASLVKRSQNTCGLACGQLASAPFCYFADGLSVADIKGLCSGADPLDQLGQHLARPHLEESGYTSSDHTLDRLLPLNWANNLANQLLFYCL